MWRRLSWQLAPCSLDLVSCFKRVVATCRCRAACSTHEAAPSRDPGATKSVGFTRAGALGVRIELSSMCWT
eukprot:3555114-Pyramimonas_sp.AAC.1